MKTALITTTINVPRVLELYRKHGEDVKIFVAFDRKSPLLDIQVLPTDDNYSWLTCHYQSTQGYACSELIGWNTIGRRNIALLEALKWGADGIVTIDDDNIPLELDYFTRIARYLTGYPYAYKAGDPLLFSGLRASSPWFDVGRLLLPSTSHRGFPIGIKPDIAFDHVVNARVGVAAGICLGDPDIAAHERITNAPIVHGVSEVLRAGIVTDPRKTWTVFNSQNTAFLRELAPAMFMLPGIGRYDDIFASLITQRVMRERGLHVHFGKPFVWQQRNKHNLATDLRNEMLGLEKVEQFAQYLDRTSLPFVSDAPIVNMVRFLLNGFNKLPNSYDLLPAASIEAGMAWCDDCEKIL